MIVSGSEYDGFHLLYAIELEYLLPSHIINGSSSSLLSPQSLTVSQVRPSEIHLPLLHVYSSPPHVRPKEIAKKNINVVSV